MSIFKKTPVQKTAIEIAQDEVESALTSFLTAKENLEHANEVFLDEVAANNAYVERLNEQSAAYQAEADRAIVVAKRLGALVEPGPSNDAG